MGDHEICGRCHSSPCSCAARDWTVELATVVATLMNAGATRKARIAMEASQRIAELEAELDVVKKAPCFSCDYKQRCITELEDALKLGRALVMSHEEHIARLEAKVERLAAQGVNHYIEMIEAENKRLRAALLKIASNGSFCDCEGDPCLVCGGDGECMYCIARAALNPPAKEDNNGNDAD